VKLVSEYPRDDVLSELLRSIRVCSTVYCHSELTAPWGFRVDAQADRLRTSGESLVDIALQTGYASDVALSKAFKRYFGMSPGAFRHATQKAGERVPSDALDGSRAQQVRPVSSAIKKDLSRIP
jgi:Helix-turn-helix domain/Cupin